MNQELKHIKRLLKNLNDLETLDEQAQFSRDY